MRTNRSLITVCALICVALTYAARIYAAAEQPNFTGTWRLNRELSDNPQEKIKEAMGKKVGRLGKIMGGRGAQDRMKENASMAEVLTIAHNDPEIKVSGNNNFSRQIF